MDEHSRTGLPSAQHVTATEEDLSLLHGQTTSLSLELDTVEAQTPATPIWAWALLAASVTAVSSAGVAFALMEGVPAITLAAWRLQLTTLFLALGAVVQWLYMSPAEKAHAVNKSWLLALSGSALALHFGTWVWSVQNTSLTHSLLFVSSTPLILALGTWLMRKPISRGELLGTAIGLAGAVLLATAAASADAQVTLAGDMSALAAAVAVIVYFLCGSHLRSGEPHLPLFVYAAPVTGLAAAELSLAALALDRASIAAAGKRGVFGWAADLHWLPYVFYLALGPGIVGHTGFNCLLKYMAPLIITLSCNLEPLIGSLMGWAAGVTSTPGIWTWIGGSVVVASTCIVSISSSLREKSRRPGRWRESSWRRCCRQTPPKRTGS